MNTALTLKPLINENHYLSEKPRLGKNPSHLTLVWKNPELSPCLHKEKIEVKLELVSGATLFAYVGGNPVNWIDPEGLCFDSACIYRMKEVARTAQTFAQGNKIRKVKTLCDKWGGKPKDWKKQKGWDGFGNEFHWYSKKGDGTKYGWKRAGQSDNF